MSTTYEELNNLRKEQINKFQEWTERLFQAAYSLLENFVYAIQISNDYWTDPAAKKSRRYVEIVDLATKEPNLKLENSLNNSGELLFGLSLTFEQNPNTFPKINSHVPLAVKFNNYSIQYTFWNTEENIPAEKWYSNEQDFIEAILDLFENNLKFDPMSGHGNKPKIGFD